MSQPFDLALTLKLAAVLPAFAAAVIGRFAAATNDAERHAAIVASVQDVLPAVEGIIGKDLLDDVKFKAAVAAVADVIVDAVAKAGKAA